MKKCKHIYMPHQCIRCTVDNNFVIHYIYTLKCTKCGKVPILKNGKYRSPQEAYDYYRLWRKSKDENKFVFGTPGSGRVTHPWDYLKPCSCGCKERPLLMYAEDKLFYCGGPTDNVYAICSVCGRHTSKSDVSTAIDNWNQGLTEIDEGRHSMAHHYQSSCNHCYRYQMCKNEVGDKELTAQRSNNAKKHNAPFIYFNPDSREEYRKWWAQNGQPIGMSNHDCYMTKNDFIQKYGNPATQPADDDLKKKLARMDECAAKIEESLSNYKNNPEEFVESALKKLSGPQREACMQLAAVIALSKLENLPENVTYNTGQLKGYLECLVDLEIIDWIERKALYEWLSESGERQGIL